MWLISGDRVTNIQTQCSVLHLHLAVQGWMRGMFDLAPEKGWASLAFHLQGHLHWKKMWPYCPKWVALILGHNAKCDDLWSAGQKYWFSVFIKMGASGIFLFKNITFNGQMWCFMTVSGILNCNCCNTVVCKINLLSPISKNATLYGS